MPICSVKTDKPHQTAKRNRRFRNRGFYLLSHAEVTITSIRLFVGVEKTKGSLTRTKHSPCLNLCHL